MGKTWSLYRQGPVHDVRYSYISITCLYKKMIVTSALQATVVAMSMSIARELECKIDGDGNNVDDGHLYLEYCGVPVAFPQAGKYIQ